MKAIISGLGRAAATVAAVLFGAAAVMGILGTIMAIACAARWELGG